MKSRFKTTDPADITVSIGRIGYINVDPVYYWFDNNPLPQGIRLVRRPPASLNRLMAENRLDISPVSVTAYARNADDWLILPDLSISCLGKVMSVILVSRYPFRELDGKPVLLTDDSAAAADLVRMFFAINRIRPVFQKGKIRKADDLMKSAAAGLVIGDAALFHKWEGRFEHVWDLGEMWHDMTGLPFVFAVWAVRRSFAERYPESVSWILDMFYASRKAGWNHLEQIVLKAAAKVGISHKRCRRYYNHLRYTLGDPEFQGLTAFLEGLYANSLLYQKPVPCFFKHFAKQSAMGI